MGRKVHYTFNATISSMRCVTVRYPIADVQTVVCFLVRLDAALDHRGCHGSLPGRLGGAIRGWSAMRDRKKQKERYYAANTKMRL